MAYRAGETRPDGARRVAVTGVGLITSMGRGWQANSDGFREGRTALRDVSLFDVSQQRAQRAGELTLPAKLPKTALSARQISRVDRATAMLIHASDEALTSSGWETARVGDSLPISLGTSAGAMELGQDYYRSAVASAGRRGQASRIDGYQTQRQALKLCDAFALGGPITIISNACSSGANAIGHAFDLIAKGRAERAFAGGYDALCQLVFAGFNSLQALSTTSPRPFAADRDGLALGEGAAMFCLEPLDEARRRGATIYAEISGYGTATDRHHLTQPHPEGDAALSSMNRACAMAGCTPDAVGYINSHGTGTPLNDSAEARAISRWAGAATSDIAVSSTKGAIGHLLGGAGAVEAAICLMALEGKFLPPNVPIENRDPACEFDLVLESRQAPNLQTALTNSFGFGGANATLIFQNVAA
jgi:3-oxoacyl-[acyl-carrier-protein] synthase II